MELIFSNSDEKMVGLSISELEKELIELRKEAKKDSSLREIGEAASTILPELLSEGAGA